MVDANVIPVNTSIVHRGRNVEKRNSEGRDAEKSRMTKFRTNDEISQVNKTPSQNETSAKQDSEVYELEQQCKLLTLGEAEPVHHLSFNAKAQKRSSPKKKSSELVQIEAVVEQSTPSKSKKTVSFIPNMVSSTVETYSHEEYDRTPVEGTVTHFCNDCHNPDGIRGPRYHCQLCEDFDLCRHCFVSQAQRHVHGKNSFLCREKEG